MAQRGEGARLQRWWIGDGIGVLPTPTMLPCNALDWPSRLPGDYKIRWIFHWQFSF